MGKASRDKGKRGEREAAAALTEQGFDARRGQQFKGSPDSPDVDCPALNGHFHFEVKRTERLKLYDALDQARAEAPPTVAPVVMHKRNRHRWVVVMDFEDWCNLVRNSDWIAVKKG